MTFAQLLTDVYDRCKYESSPPAAVTARFSRGLNKWHRQILSNAGMRRLRDDIYVLTTTSAVGLYSLPPVVTRINAMTYRNGNVVLEERSLDWLRTRDPGLTATGGPSYIWIPMGYRQIAQHPSDASEIFVKSTSASDNASVTAYLEGVRSGGFAKQLSVAMNGTTAVSFGAAFTDFIQIDKFYLSAAALGTVTLHEDSGAGTELAKIPIGSTYARYFGIQLYPTPSAESYHVDYTRNIPDLANSTDEPLLPLDFHWLLAVGAEADEWRRLNDRRATAALAELSQGMKDLRNWVLNSPMYQPDPLNDGPSYSRLGPWYPAGT